MTAPETRLQLVVLADDQDVPDVRGLPGVDIRLVGGADLPHALPSADVLLVWDFTAAGLAEAWHHAQRLRWMHVNSAGVDKVLTPPVVASDVLVTNAAGVLDESLAEYVLGLLLAMVKDLPGTLDRQRRHRWEHRPTRRLAGRRVLVVGLGGIGRATARLLTAVGCTVDGAARRARASDPDVGVVHAADDLRAVIGQYDVIVLAAPLTAATRGLVDRRMLDAMAPDAVLVNVGRGGLVDEDALADALVNGRLAGAALDVFAAEPLPADHPLWDCPGTIVSPHMSGDYIGWRDDLLALFTDNLSRFMRGEPLCNIVDKDLGYPGTP